MSVLGPPGQGGGGGGGGDNLFDRLVQKAQQGAADMPPDEPLLSGDGNRRKIVLYKNGFTVDDGPLRDNSSPESRAFLHDLEQGRVPAELAKAISPDKRYQLEVALEDKRSEEYVAPPPPAYVAFSKGTALGSVQKSSTEALVINAELIASLGPASPLDESKPSTTLQVKTVDGKRLRIKMNLDATVLQLASEIHRQGAGADSYILSSGFPPKDIVDGSQTLEQAGLQGAALTLKKV